MSGVSEKHMERARVLAMDLYHNAVDSDDGSQSMDMGVAAPLIASALCNAQREGFREGMKRAAEICDALADREDAGAVDAGCDTLTPIYRRGERIAQDASRAILAEAGEG